MSDLVLNPDIEVNVGTRGAVRQALSLRRTQVGLLITVILVFIAVFGPLFAPHGATEYIDMPNSLGIAGAPFGTDYLGQDVLSRFLRGGSSILLLGLASTLLGISVGTTLGMTAAYAKGRIDEILMRIFDVLLSFPQILLALVAISMFGSSPWLVIFAVALSTMPRVARIVRGASLSVVDKDFIYAATALGESRRRVIFFELFPNIASTLLVEANLRFTYSIGTIASLSFLGFSPNPTAANWGLMVQENSSAISVQPWGVVLPTIAIALLTIGTGLMGDGLSRVSAGIDRKSGG